MSVRDDRNVLKIHKVCGVFDSRRSRSIRRCAVQSPKFKQMVHVPMEWHVVSMKITILETNEF